MDAQPAQTNPVQTPETPQAAPSSPPPPPQPANPAPPPSGKHHGLLAIIAVVILAVGFGCLALWFLQKESIKKPEAIASKITPTASLLSDTIVVGTDPTYPPMEFTEGNNLTGYDIDLANFIGKELGMQVKFKNIVFDDLFPSLEKKEIDMIISTVTVTEERKKQFDFSEPYLQGGQVILTKKDNDTIMSTTDLRGKKIAVQKGTTIETEALKYTSDELVIRYPDFVEATEALVAGKVDAIFVDLPGAKGIITANPSLKIASDPFNKEYYAIVFRKGDPSIATINKALGSLRVKGILADLKQEWLDP